MDPVSLILAAIVTGGAKALEDTAGGAVRDAYGSLKALVKRKLGRDEAIVDEAEAAPAVWEKPLEQRLRTAGAENDPELVAAAQQLLALVDPEGSRAGKYTVNVSGGKGVVVGDNATVTMNFDGD